MHPTLDILAIILFSAVGLYMLFLIYLKITKAGNIKDLVPEDKLEEYKKIKNKHMMVFIIGLLVGFVIVLVKDKKIIETVINNKYIQSINNISDVEDISVL
jgi:hypothetical protein